MKLSDRRIVGLTLCAIITFFLLFLIPRKKVETQMPVTKPPERTDPAVPTEAIPPQNPPPVASDQTPSQEDAPDLPASKPALPPFAGPVPAPDPNAVPVRPEEAFPENLAIDLSTEEARAKSVARIKAAEDANLRLAMQTAAQKNWPLYLDLEGGRRVRLTGIRKDGSPIYSGPCNVIAAVSANIYPLRTSNYHLGGLTGLGWRVGVWEPEQPLFNHPEFGNRVEGGPFETGSGVPDAHATHVIGTILAQGIKQDARGMAPLAKVVAYTAESDTSEMTKNAAINGNLGRQFFISNHSYGTSIGWAYGKFDKNDNPNKEPVWLGGPGETRDSKAGLYDVTAFLWDALVYSAEYYLPFNAAGNDRGGKLRDGSTFYWRLGTTGKFERNEDIANAPGEDGGRPGGYETISMFSNAKNIMTIGNAEDAVRADWTSSAITFFTSLGSPIIDFFQGSEHLNDYEKSYLSGALVRDPSAAVPHSSSCWGPTDDGRIKPDVMANGTALYSTSVATKDGQIVASYENKTGTSMASPTAAGAAVLMQQYYYKLFGSAMRSSMLKALILHTADELDATGPDYRTGWGLINATAAVEQIKSAHVTPEAKHLYDGYLADADPDRPSDFTKASDGLNFEWDGESSQIKATIVWNDPPGKQLSNDLDLRLITPSGETVYPWVLNPEQPEQAATRGDNVVDNVEQIIAPAQRGRYTLMISRKGILNQYSQLVVEFGRQDFSLVLSGNGPVSQFQEGLDQPELEWNTGGNVPWTLATSGSRDGVDYAASKFTSAPQASFVETVVDGGQRVTWWWTIAGPPGISAPILFLTDNGKQVARLDGTSPWQPRFFDLPPGRHTLRWTFSFNGGADPATFSAGIDMIKFGPPAPRGPFTASTPRIPGKIEAENFDKGEAGEVYADRDITNNGGGHRPEVGVDIQTTTDTSGGFEIFDTQDGEWLEYTADVLLTGLYSLELRYAAAVEGSVLRIGNRQIDFPSTGGADKWRTFTVEGFQLPNGPLRLRLEWVKGGARLNWMNWINKPWPDKRAFASEFNPAGLPVNIAVARIQAENFDTGGESIAYHDIDIPNTGGQYRPDESVDIERSDDPDDTTGFHVTRFQKGEYLKYSVLAPEFDDYEVRLRIKPGSLQGFTFDHGAFEVSLGERIVMTFSESTSQWITLIGRVRQLTRGIQDLTITCTDGMAEMNWIEIVRVPPTGITKILYRNVPGNVLEDFYPAPRGKGQFPKGFEFFSHPLVEMPLQSGRLNGLFEIPTDVDGSYGVILAGYILPRFTDDYIFYICSDDQGELWLSTDETPDASRLIAYEEEWNSSRAWVSTERRHLLNGHLNNASDPIRLQANNFYYIEAIAKEGGGNDNLAIAWRRAGEPAIVNGDEPISAQFLRPLNALPLYEVKATWPAPAPITYGTPLGASQLNLTLLEFQQAGTISYDPPEGTVLPAGTHTLTATFTPNLVNKSVFKQTTFTVSLVVNPAQLMVRAANVERQLGQPNTGLAVIVTGLVNGDTVGHLQEPIQFNTSASVASPEGNYEVTPVGGSNPNYAITFLPGTLKVTQGAKRAFSNNELGSPLPGRIEAEDFDHGDEGLGFHDSDAPNVGGQYRLTEGVDLETCADEGGGFNVGWTAPGEWQEYTVNVAKSGLYDLTLRIAQLGDSCSIRVWMAGSPVTSAVLLPDTAGFQNWVSVTKWSIPLSAGKQVMRVEWLSGGANLNWVEWRPSVNNTPKSIVWWKFDRGFADAVLQRLLLPGSSSGASLAGPILNTDSPTSDSGDLAASFDGTEFAHLPEREETEPLTFEGKDYTVEAWVKFTRPGNAKSMLVTWGRPGGGGWSTWIDANGNLGATSYGIVDLFTTANLPDDEQWHHVAFVHQVKRQMFFYIDGVLRQTLNTPDGVLPTADRTIHVGYELVDGLPINPLIGKIDRLRVTDLALQPSQLDFPARPSDANTHGLNRLVYRYLPGSLNDFYPEPRGRAHFPLSPEPAGTGPLQSGILNQFEAPDGAGVYYGQALFGYIVPSVTADYTFYIAAGGQAELWLSTNENPENSVLLATEPVGNSSRDWLETFQRPLVNGRSANVSPVVHLEADKYYYVEVAMKAGGFDNVAVTWQASGTPAPTKGSPPIPGENLRTVLIKPPGEFIIPSIRVTLSKPNIVLTWPDTPGVILESSPRVGPGAAWSNVPFDVSNGSASATITATGSSSFFRLNRI